MHKYLKPLVIASATGILSTLAIATTLAFANSTSAPEAASAFHGSAPLNYSRGYTGTHGSASLNHNGRYTGTHGSASLSHGEGHSDIHTISQTMVVSVAEGSPADVAGLKAGDLIVAIDGKAVASPKDLPNVVSAKKPGDTLRLDVKAADGTSRSISVTLGKSTGNAGSAYLGVNYGFPHRVKGEKLGEQYEQNGYAGRGGFEGHGGWDTGTVIIRSVQADSPAAKAGLQAGDVINQVNGTTLNNPAALKSTFAGLKPGNKVTMNLLRNGQAQTIEVTLGESPDKKGMPYLGVTFGHDMKHAPKTTPATTNTVG